MRRKPVEPTLDNILRLFAKHLGDFSGESKRSYQKAYSSFQIFVIGNYSMSGILDSSVIENWVIFNYLQGLSSKTVSFYLDKLASLYSRVAHNLTGGKTSIFKDLKKKIKDFTPAGNYSAGMKGVTDKIRHISKKSQVSGKKNPLIDAIKTYPLEVFVRHKATLDFLWGNIALAAGILPDEVKSTIGEVPSNLDLLGLCGSNNLGRQRREEIARKVNHFIEGEEKQWFAMRLRPRVKYEGLLQRFSLISNNLRMPELFYPSEEIARRIGRKLVWKGKPVIRDVVFFKSRKSEIYPLFTKLYDLAWCYRTPGSQPGNYASIPEKAMLEFKKSLGFLNPDFEVAPAGEMKLKPGDEVVIVNGDYINQRARILKSSGETEEGHKIFRVTLLNLNGRWDIGIDARLIKKV